MVGFSRIPKTGNKVPLLRIEVDNSKANTSVGDTLNGLLTGFMAGAGTAQAGKVVAVGGPFQANRLFGKGSMLARMCARYFQINGSTPLFCLPLAPMTGGTAAAGSITVATAPTGSGTIALYIAGQLVQVTVLAGNTAAQVATAMAAAINAAPELPVAAAVDGTNTAKVNVTAAAGFKGLIGNDITLSDSYRGVVGGEQLPDGLTLTYSGAQLSGGTGVPDWSTAIANLGDDAYEYVGQPFTDPGSLTAWATEYGFGDSGRWGSIRQLYGQLYGAYRGTYSALMSYGPSNNAPTTTLMAIEAGVPSPVWEVAAAYAAQAAAALSADPARPLQTLPLDGILVARKEDRFSKLELNAIGGGGLAIQGTVAGTMVILREQTTYQVNAYGEPDNSYELITTLATLGALFRRLIAAVTNKYPRHKLANNGTRFGPGQAIVTPNLIKAELVAEAVGCEYDGLIEDAANFKANLVVERSSNDPDRVDVVYPPDLVNGLRMLAVLGQFRLQYAATGAA